MSRSPEYIHYLKTPLSPQVIQTIFNSNGVTYEKTKLFGDFIKSFMLRTFNTYLDGVDSKIYTQKQQQINHFNWCWNQTVIDFGNEGIIFHDDEKIKNYLMGVMLKSFYTFEDKSLSGVQVKRALNLWVRLFQYNGGKSQVDVDTFLELYRLFDNSLKGKMIKRLDL